MQMSKSLLICCMKDPINFGLLTIFSTSFSERKVLTFQKLPSSGAYCESAHNFRQIYFCIKLTYTAPHIFCLRLLRSNSFYFRVTSKRVEIIRSHRKTNELFAAREAALRQSQSFQQFRGDMEEVRTLLYFLQKTVLKKVYNIACS